MIRRVLQIAALLTGALLLFLAYTGWAPTFASESMERPRIPTRIHFDHLGVDQGLSQGSILCMLQDSRGYLWIGTQDGLNRYDGYSFAIYRHSPADPESLSQHTITALAEDRRGVIWAGTAQGWLNAYDRATGTFTRFGPDPDETAPSNARNARLILEDRSGLYWVVLGDEIYTFDRESGSYTHYPTTKIAFPNRFPTVRLYEDNPGTLWYAVNGELFRFLRTEGRFEAVTLPYDETSEVVEVFGFFEDEPGKLMVVSTEGVFEFDPEGNIFMPWGERRFQSIWNPRRWDICSWLRDESGLWWMASRSEGLYLFDLETLSYSNYQNDPRDDTSLSPRESG